MVGLCIKNTNWLERLLRNKFFDSCALHQELRKNEENVFCVDCNIGCCRHCIKKSHCLHRRLQICKYVYHEVVRLHDIQKLLDCSKIQTYKINGEKAIHLKPRPQAKDAKPSTKAKFGSSCVTCAKYLQDVPNQFCSIACKEFPELSWMEDERHLISENESSLSLTDVSDQDTNSALKPRRQLHKRKGVPRRAPFC